MMEYEKLYAQLTPALRRWCDQAAAGAAEDDRYLVGQRAARQAHQYYTEFSADHDPELAEVMTLTELGAPQSFAPRRARKRARAFLIAAIAAAAVLVVVDAVALTALVPSAWLNLTSPSGANLAGELAATNVATVVLVAVLAVSAPSSTAEGRVIPVPVPARTPRRDNPGRRLLSVTVYSKKVWNLSNISPGTSVILHHAERNALLSFSSLSLPPPGEGSLRRGELLCSALPGGRLGRKGR